MPATHATGERATPQDRAIFLGRRWPASACEALRLALVPLCVVVAVAVRRRVAADDLSDAADLALTAGALLFVLAALGISFRLARPGRGLARQAVPVALVLVAGMFVARSFADVSIEMHSLGTARDSVAAVIVPGPDGTDVRYSGEIHEGDAARLARLLDAYPQATRIHLTSEGGLADEGQALGAVIASHHLTTYVPDFCVSACTLAFLAGKERLALRDARLGFHGPFEEGLFGQTFAGDAGSVRAAYRAAGLDQSFIDEALAAAPDDMWFPDPKRLTESGVVTAFVDRDRLPDSNLDGAATLAGARAAVLRNVPILSGLATTTPALVDRIAGWYLEAYRHDWSEERVVGGLHALSDSAVALAAAGANDRTLVDLARVLSTAMESADKATCVAIGANGDLVTAVEQDGDKDGSVAKVAALLGAAMTGPRVGTPHAGESMKPTSIAFAGGQAASCGALRRAYRGALARPVPEAAALLRPRFQGWARRSIVTLAAAISEP